MPAITNLQRGVDKTAEHIERLKVDFPHNVVPIISIEHYDMMEHQPGVLMEANIPVAAKMLTKHTHRIATPEEQQAYRDDLQRRTEDLHRQELEKKGVTTHVTPIEIGRPRQVVKQGDK